MVVEQEAPDTFEHVFRVLRDGGTVIMRCDTIYGIVGISPECNRRIALLKGREGGKPFLKLIADDSWLERFTPSHMPAELKRCWPGPLTVVFHARRGGTVGLRVPADITLLRLLRRLEKPLISTSVNRSGEPAYRRIEAIVRDYEKRVDLIVNGGDQENAEPSTVLDLTAAPPRILRQGRMIIPPEVLDGG